ncbi:MAG: EAL domain-containing protein [Gammaproteobacteria bacterium]|nr:EAL domain-containing protein [Gammaproteobacteria bacterium]
MRFKKINAGLVFGFSIALTLLIVIFIVGLSSMAAIQNRLKTIAQNHNVKTELVTSMRYAVRERTVSLYRMLLLKDPVERDEEFTMFNRYAIFFMQARNSLMAMELSKDEQQALEREAELTRKAVALQVAVIDLVVTDQTEQAMRLMYTKSLATQDEVFKILNELIEMQRVETERAVVESTKEYQRARKLMLVFGLIAFSLSGVVSIVVVRRTSNTEARLFRQKERVQVTLNSIADGVITTDAQGRVEYLNPTGSELTGWSLREAKGKELFDVLTIIDDEGYPPTVNPVLQAMQEKRIINNNDSMTLVRKNGDNYAVELTVAPIKDYDGSITGAVLIFRNVTAIRDMANQMVYQATHDSLTGLINRNEFERRLNEAIHVARNNEEKHVLCYVDLDQFKVVNDTCGHRAGDELLKQLTVELHRKVRKSDTLGRLGGDEFGILFLDCSLDKALEIAEVVRKSIKESRFIWGDKAFEIGASIGVVAINAETGGMSEIMSAADSACFVAKDLGRNRIHVYQLDDKLLAKHRGEMQWLPRIREALEENNFVLYFQRIMSLLDAKQQHNIELLIRMGDRLNSIPPMAFLPAAERYDLMPEIDRWVIKNAFRELGSFQHKHPNEDYIWTINISGQSLCDEAFLDFVVEQYQYYSVKPFHVCFEITETAAVANLVSASHLIAKLTDQGFQFALDDFGSGLSSFNYLKNLPVDYIKIDGSFVKDIVDDPIDCAMVESINQIGHKLGLKTIAEFVEDEQTLEKLRIMGVDFVQGRVIHEPEPLQLYSEEKGTDSETVAS